MRLIDLLNEDQNDVLNKERKSITSMVYVGFGLISLCLVFLVFAMSELSNPYLTSLDLLLPSNQIKREEAIKHVKRLETEDSYHVNGTSSFFRWYKDVKDEASDNDSKTFYYRTIAPDDPLLKTIIEEAGLEREEMLEGSEFSDMANSGVIITQRLITECNYIVQDSHIYLYNSQVGGEHFAIPVLGIVENLPNRSDIICTEEFYKTTLRHATSKIADNPYRNPVHIFIPKEYKDNLKGLIEGAMVGLSITNIDTLSYIGKEGFKYSLSFNTNNFQGSKADSLLFETVRREHKQAVRLQESAIRTNDIPETMPYNMISIQLESIWQRNLDSIRGALLPKKLDLDYGHIKRLQIIGFMALSIMVSMIVIAGAVFTLVSQTFKSTIANYFQTVRKYYGQLIAIGIDPDNLIKANREIFNEFLISIMKQTKFNVGLFILMSLNVVVMIGYFDFSKGLLVRYGVCISLVVVFCFLIHRFFLLPSIQKKVDNILQRDPGKLIYDDLDSGT